MICLLIVTTTHYQNTFFTFHILLIDVFLPKCVPKPLLGSALLFRVVFVIIYYCVLLLIYYA